MPLTSLLYIGHSRNAMNTPMYTGMSVLLIVSMPAVNLVLLSTFDNMISTEPLTINAIEALIYGLFTNFLSKIPPLYLHIHIHNYITIKCTSFVAIFVKIQGNSPYTLACRYFRFLFEVTFLHCYDNNVYFILNY